MFCGNLAVGVHNFTISSSFFHYAACPATRQKKRIGTYGSLIPMQSFGFKYLSRNSWKLRWHCTWAKNVHCKQDCTEGLSYCQLLPSLPQGSRLWVTAPKTCVHSMPEICLSQLLSKVTTVTGLKKWVEGREVQVSFGCLPQGYWALS